MSPSMDACAPLRTTLAAGTVRPVGPEPGLPADPLCTGRVSILNTMQRITPPYVRYCWHTVMYVTATVHGRSSVRQYMYTCRQLLQRISSRCSHSFWLLFLVFLVIPLFTPGRSKVLLCLLGAFFYGQPCVCLACQGSGPRAVREDSLCVRSSSP